MDIQTLIALLLVLAAALYMGRRTMRSMRAGQSKQDDGGSCGSGPGCCG